MPKLERLVELIRLTRHRAGSDVKEMSRVCGVSQRTIYRYLNTLAQMNLPRELTSDQKVKAADEGGEELSGDDRSLLRFVLDNNPVAGQAFFSGRLERLRHTLAPCANGRGRRLRGQLIETGLKRTAPQANAQSRLLQAFARACRSGNQVTVELRDGGRNVPGLAPELISLTPEGIQLRFRECDSGRLKRLSVDEIYSLRLQSGPSGTASSSRRNRKKG